MKNKDRLKAVLAMILGGTVGVPIGNYVYKHDKSLNKNAYKVIRENPTKDREALNDILDTFLKGDYPGLDKKIPSFIKQKIKNPEIANKILLTYHNPHLRAFLAEEHAKGYPVLSKLLKRKSNWKRNTAIAASLGATAIGGSLLYKNYKKRQDQMNAIQASDLYNYYNKTASSAQVAADLFKYYLQKEADEPLKPADEPLKPAGEVKPNWIENLFNKGKTWLTGGGPAKFSKAIGEHAENINKVTNAVSGIIPKKPWYRTFGGRALGAGAALTGGGVLINSLSRRD